MPQIIVSRCHSTWTARQCGISFRFVRPSASRRQPFLQARTRGDSPSQQGCRIPFQPNTARMKLTKFSFETGCCKPDYVQPKERVVQPKCLLTARSRAPHSCRRACTARAVTAEAEALEQRNIAPATHQSLRVQYQLGQIVAAGCQPLLEDVNPEVFVCRSSDEALILGVDSSSGATSMHDMALGKLNCKRFLACARCKLWWMTPEWGSKASQIPPETQFLLLELAEGGPYAVLLPLIDNNTFRATLRPFKFSEPAAPSREAEEKLHLRIESGDSSVLGSRWSQALYIAAGWEPFELVERAVVGASSLSGGAKARQKKQLPPSLDAFGWCTWDAFYSRVSARGLHQGLQSLADGGVPSKLLIIDDGWQSTDVDAALRQPVSQKLRLAEPMRELDETQGEFIEAELEMLQMSARNVPAGSTLGVALEALSADEENLTHHKRSKSNPDMPWRKSKSERRRRKAEASGQKDYESDDSSSWSSEGQPSVLLESMARDGGETSTSGRGEDSQLPAQDRRALAKADAGTLTPVEKQQLVESAGLQLQLWKPPQMPLMWLLSAVTQRFVGLVFGLLEAVLIKFYQYVVDPAAPDSWPNKLFTILARGPIKGLLLEFLATSGDFTRRLTGIEANSKFSTPFAGPEEYFSGRPAQLGTVVQSLKDRFKLDFVYCWHGLPAYWSGVATPEDAPSMAKYNARLVYARPTRGLYEIEPSAAWNPSVIAGVGVVQDVQELYNDMHRYLADSGVTGVKVDCQAGVGLVGSALGGGAALAAQYQAALEDSVALHFQDNHVINCMCHSTENLYRMRDTAVVRASDDFYPRNEASSHPHVAACAFNSVFLGALAQPDWDMFHSKHPAAMLHATARALSGGAVYVSDYPGQHSFEILRKLVLPDGSILRALLPGRPARDSLFSDVLRDERSLLKVWNMNAYTGVVGVFHLQGSSWDRSRRQFVTHARNPVPLKTQVRPTDVESFAQAAHSPSAQWHAAEGVTTSWAAYSNVSDEVVVLRADQGIPVALRCGHSAVVTFAPVLEAEGLAFAAIGLTDMLNSGGAVLGCSLRRRTVPVEPTPSQPRSGRNGSKPKASRGMTGEVSTRGCGRFEMYASQEPESCLLDGDPLNFAYDAARSRLLLTLPRADKLLRTLQITF